MENVAALLHQKLMPALVAMLVGTATSLPVEEAATPIPVVFGTLASVEGLASLVLTMPTTIPLGEAGETATARASTTAYEAVAILDKTPNKVSTLEYNNEMGLLQDLGLQAIPDMLAEILAMVSKDHIKLNPLQLLIMQQQLSPLQQREILHLSHQIHQLVGPNVFNKMFLFVVWLFQKSQYLITFLINYYLFIFSFIYF